MPIYNSKVVFGSDTIMDITDTTAVATDVLTGKKFYGKDGAPVTGTCAYDSNTTDANALATEILATKTAYVNKNKVTGTMVNNGAVTGTIASKDAAYTIPAGYHDGAGTVQISDAQKLLLIPGNIKMGTVLLGVTGSYSGESITAQAKTVIASTAEQIIQPDTDYDYLSQVTVKAIIADYVVNAQGGYTVTIPGSGY